MTVDAANDVMVAVSWPELRKVSFDNEVKGAARRAAIVSKLSEILKRLR
jgi:hypothetical protein